MDDKWFKKRLRAAGVTAQDVADRLGRDRSVVSRLYVGRQQMTLDQAQVFAQLLKEPVAEILRRAGVMPDAPEKNQRPGSPPGLGDSDATPWQGRDSDPNRQIAQALGAARAGVDVWRVRGMQMAQAGLLPGDYMLIDSHAADRCAPGDIVIAQHYQRDTATTVLRRFEPPVLVSASPDPADGRVLVIDGTNVVVRGKVLASWRDHEARARDDRVLPQNM